MSARIRNHLLAILGIAIVAFWVGFSPVRWHAEKPRFKDLYRVAFSHPMAGREEALDTVRNEIQTALEDRGVVIKEVRFASPTAATIQTHPPLRAQDEQADESSIREVLRKKDQNVAVEAQVSVQGTGPQPVASLGPIKIVRPVPQINLGLDLQGGAHVVMECMPRTEMRFEAPEGKPFTTPVGVDSGEPPAEEKPARPEAEGDEQQAPEAQPETKEQAPAKEEPKQPAPRSEWKPKESPATLKQKIMAALNAAGMQHIEVTIPSAYVVDVASQARNEDECKQQQSIVAGVLRETYPGLELQEHTPGSVFLEPGTADKVKHIIDLKLYALSGVKEPVVQKQGNTRIIIEIPGLKDAADMDRIKQILRTEANLEFKLVPQQFTYREDQTTGERTWRNAQTNKIVAEEDVVALSSTEFRGRDLKSNAQVITGSRGDYEVQFTLRDSQQLAFHEFTRRNVGRIMAIVLDAEMVMAPEIKSPIPGTGTISGNMDMKEASDLKLLLNAGALPVPLKIVEDRSISATLGTDTIRKSLRAGLVGFLVVVVFMVAYYRVPGLMADLALVIYVVLFLAVLAMGNATLTLPGVAGVILSIGMAVDANVIIFERLKEELRVRSTARAAVEAGFARAWTAILDANVTTCIAAAVLYWLGTSTIKSFAVTLFWGVLVSMFTAITVSRWLVMAFAASRYGQRPALYGLRGRRAATPMPVGR